MLPSKTHQTNYHETHVFLDLEGTLIDSWDNPVIVNTARIKQILAREACSSPTEPTKVTIFSFAIDGKHDKEIFDSNIKNLIEAAHNIEVVNVVTAEEVHKKFKKRFGLMLELFEFKRLGKDFGFRVWVEFNKGHHILVDDMVEGHDVDVHESDLSIKFIKV